MMIVRRLYQRCKLVHADLSEYNLLYYKDEVWVIDVSQAVEHDHPMALDFLRRDCSIVQEFYSKKLQRVLTTQDTFSFVTDLSIENEDEEAVFATLVQTLYAKTDEQLEAEKQRLEVAQMKTEQLLLNILPRSIAERLKRGEKNIAGHYPESTVLFSDIVGFTKMSAEISAADLVNLLNDLFTRFDKRAESLGLEKIKTIGDAYMAVGGLPIPRADHAEICADMALGMFEDLHAFNQQRGKALDLRIGLNSGPVVAGVIGYTKFSYDLWGNTVNTASRMESTSPPGRVQASPTTVELLKGHFELDWRPEPVDCKGLGLIQTALVGNRKR